MKLIILKLIIILLVFKITKQEKIGIINLNFTYIKEDELLKVSIKIGEPSQNIEMILDLSSERTWVSDIIYLYNNSNKFKTDHFIDSREEGDFSYKGYWSRDTFILGDTILEKFDFLLVNQIINNNKFKGVLSLGREYDSKRFSLAYRLSAISATFFNSFVIKFFNDKEGELIFGDLTKESKLYYNDINKCKIINKNPLIKWKCMLTHFFIGNVKENKNIQNYEMNQLEYVINDNKNKIKVIDKPVSFESLYNKIYVENDFMNYLYLNIFSECKIENEEYNSYFICDKNIISKLPKLNFVLSDVTCLSFSPNILFDCNENKCISLIQYNKLFPNFSFGILVLKNFEMIFEYNIPYISFYGKENKYLVKMPNRSGFSFINLLVYFMIFIILVLLSLISFIYIMRRKNNKRRKIEKEIYEKF
jgi:hypothetical protein